MKPIFQTSFSSAAYFLQTFANSANKNTFIFLRYNKSNITPFSDPGFSNNIRLLYEMITSHTWNVWTYKRIRTLIQGKGHSVLFLLNQLRLPKNLSGRKAEKENSYIRILKWLILINPYDMMDQKRIFHLTKQNFSLFFPHCRQCSQNMSSECGDGEEAVS